MIETTEAYGLTFSFPAGDLTIGPCLRDYGEFSRIGMTLAEQIARGRCFVDVGANIGAFALPVSRTAASVIAIEAHPGLADLLRDNIRTNGLENIRVIHAAAGAAAGQVSFPAPSFAERINFGSLGVGQAGATQLIDIVRLDDVAPTDTAMIKIDVEGYELAVLAGAKRLLREVRPTWLVEYHDPELVTLLRESGYSTYWFFDAFVTPRAPKKKWSGKFRGDLSVLAVPSERPQPLGMVEAGVPVQPPLSTAGFDYLRSFGMLPTAIAQER